MPTSYPLSTLAAAVTSSGITSPSYADILASLKASAALIFGSDVYLEADSQDGQLLAIFAQAIYDCNQATIAVYNSFSPATSYGEGLSSMVRINNITRKVPTHSQVNVLVVGAVGTTITNGVAGDVNGNRWLLPSSVVIPLAGQITVTATAEQAGAVTAAANTVIRMLTPTAGWQSVTNAASAIVGQPVESDGELRLRQATATSLGASTPLAALAAALHAIPGVTYGAVYENDTAVTDTNGVPPFSIAVIVSGGDINTIANTIYNKKSPGVGTYGTTTVNVTDVSGALRPIKFSIPSSTAIKVLVQIYADAGYVSDTGAAIAEAVAAHINALAVGGDVVVTRLYDPALLKNSSLSLTYRVASVQAALLAGVVGSADVPIAINSKATCSSSNVTIQIIT